MSIGVQVPPFNSSVNMNNSISEAQNITLDYQPVLEQMEIQISNVVSGTYSIQMNSRVRDNLKYNMDPGTMAWTIERFGFYGDASVVLDKLDDSGVITTNSSLITSYKYLITFRCNRRSGVGQKPFIITSGLKAITGKKVTTSVKILSTPSDIMTGHFNVSLNSKTV